MKASNIERVQALLSELKRVQTDLIGLAAVPAIPNGIHVGFRYLTPGDPKKKVLHLDLDDTETKQIRDQVHRLLISREERITAQLGELGVDPKG